MDDLFAMKLWQADFTQVLSGFDFSDLLSLAKKEIGYLQRRMINAAQTKSSHARELPDFVRRSISARILPNIESEILFGAPIRVFKRHFSSIIGELPQEMIGMLRDNEILDEDGGITRYGREILRSMIRDENT